MLARVCSVRSLACSNARQRQLPLTIYKEIPLRCCQVDVASWRTSQKHQKGSILNYNVLILRKSGPILARYVSIFWRKHAAFPHYYVLLFRVLSSRMFRNCQLVNGSANLWGKWSCSDRVLRLIERRIKWRARTQSVLRNARVLTSVIVMVLKWKK